MKSSILCILLLLLANTLSAQQIQKDKGTFIENNDTYYKDSILMGIKKYEDSTKPIKKKHFAVDFSGIKLPTSPDEFTKCWFNEPICQGRTGNCWSFATTSFFESEIFRLSGKKVKLSEMYFVYWKYVERAREFVNNKGNFTIKEGSDANLIPKLMKMYGAVPLSAYSGLLKGQTEYDHKEMLGKIQKYLESVKRSCAWNDSLVIDNVKALLNMYMGKPPEEFEFSGKKYVPISFLSDYCQLSSKGYYSFKSNSKYPFTKMSDLNDGNNFAYGKGYINVNADNFIKVIKNAVAKGYSIIICGDITEPGIDNQKQVAIIPTFDIPPAYIDDDARQFRIDNKTTEDQHCLHLVGYKEENGVYWFLVKDSNAGAFDGKYPGYKYLREDYVKLKMMNILLNKDAVKELLEEILK